MIRFPSEGHTVLGDTTSIVVMFIDHLKTTFEVLDIELICTSSQIKRFLFHDQDKDLCDIPKL